MNRQTWEGKEIGREYALQCIQSWRNSGFDLVSVNAEGERLSELISGEGIKLITVKRNASVQFGRPLVYLDDLIAAARSLTEGPAVVINSDILLELTPAMQQQISNIRPGQCVFSRRTDIHSLDSRTGEQYTRGYDFFAFHTRDLSTFSNQDFVFGMPWWDHYFPIHMYLRGLKPLPATKPFAFHLAHDERWDIESWMLLGKRFLQLIQREISSLPDNETLAHDYVQRCERAVLGSDVGFVSRAGIALRGFTHRGKVENEIRMFDRVGAANMQWLDELGSRQT